MSRTIKKIIIHCTDSQDSLDVGFKEINDWHKERGWLSPSGISCGYHYIVRRDGSIELGRPPHETGAHVYKHNKTTIGVVWVGRDNPSNAQMATLLHFSRALVEQYKLKGVDDVLGHCELDHMKTCPNLDMLKFRGHLLFTPIRYVSDKIKDIAKP